MPFSNIEVAEGLYPLPKSSSYRATTSAKFDINFDLPGLHWGPDPPSLSTSNGPCRGAIRGCVDTAEPAVFQRKGRNRGKEEPKAGMALRMARDHDAIPNTAYGLRSAVVSRVRPMKAEDIPITSYRLPHTVHYGRHIERSCTAAAAAVQSNGHSHVLGVTLTAHVVPRPGPCTWTRTSRGAPPDTPAPRGSYPHHGPLEKPPSPFRCQWIIYKLTPTQCTCTDAHRKI